MLRSVFLATAIAALTGMTELGCGEPDLAPVRPHGVGTDGRGNPPQPGDDDRPDEPQAPPASATPSDPAPAPSTPPAPTDTIWRGTLQKTPTIVFGGSPYCDYRVTFTDITMKLVVGQDGVVKSSEVIGRMSEEAPSCPHKPIPNNLNTFRLSTKSTARAGLDVALTGLESNAPRSNLVFEGATDTNGTIAGTLRIHRKDIGAPFDWTVVANIRLAKSAE